MATWVQPNEVEPLLDAVGGKGMNILVDFKTEEEIERVYAIAEKYR
jgi:indole-3-glycerol phosphate synthase